jgi:hypothetical protein
MYTIGTSGIKYVASQVADPTIQAALTNKLVAFVGTIGERDGDDTVLHPPTLISPYSVFFGVPAGADAYTAAWPITTAQLYVPNDDSPIPTDWAPLGAPFDQAFITPNLLPAGGLGEAIYAFMRGNAADRSAAPTIDGVAFYGRDTESLYVYDVTKARWVPVGGSGGGSSTPVGSMVLWPEALDTYNPLPALHLRADGTLQMQAVYPALYAVIKDSFEDIMDPSPAGRFRLPNYSGMIIKYE